MNRDAIWAIQVGLFVRYLLVRCQNRLMCISGYRDLEKLVLLVKRRCLENRSLEVPTKVEGKTHPLNEKILLDKIYSTMYKRIYKVEKRSIK